MTAILDDETWIAWLAIIVAAVVVEMRRLDLAALCVGAAALAALLSGLVGAPWWLQALVAVAAATALLRAARAALLRAFPVDGAPDDDGNRVSHSPDASDDDVRPA
ncbi:hypothetical protein DZG00_01080 [Clavibacter lycopersici]|uniref:NfeD family protein n=1 Tax=Clavibacter lycopersici TaxID=2301718 RepID=A0A399TE00_9MICO|nr:hypothetical protein [Clavibacter lycopersici]RIJ53372.1 hypothetical protein DZG00_01080 [Clavibacter lycopersici]RIJ62505.1 hypothetical protein DZG02_01410 [Clavibacter lycopersici]